LPNILANPFRRKPSTAVDFPCLRSKRDIEDDIGYSTASH